MIAVSPVIPGHEHLELKIAEHQPEYLTLPALHCGEGVLLTRWKFEEGEHRRFVGGAPLRLTVLHGGYGPRRHLIATGVTAPRVPEVFSELVPGPQTEIRSEFLWRPGYEVAAAEWFSAVTAFGVFLYQWAAFEPVQPLMMNVD